MEMADSQSPNLAFEKESIIIVQHGILALLLKTSNNYIQVKYQSVQASPWDTQHPIMFIFLLALFIYATALVVEVMLRASESIYQTHVGNIRLFAGGLAAILLLAILYPILGCIISLMWVCLFVKIAFESFQELYSILCQTVVGVLHMSSKLIGSVRCLEEEEPDQPPSSAQLWSMSLRKPGKNHAAVSHPSPYTLDDNSLQQVLEAFCKIIP